MVRSAPRRRFGAALGTLALLLVAPQARAQVPLSGISMSWNDCVGGATASPDLSFGCNDNVSLFRLVCALALDTTQSDLIGAELVVDLQSSVASVPDWWRLDGTGAAGCRAGALTASFDFSASPACTDAWLGQGFGDVQGFSIGPPDHPMASQARIKAVAAVTSDHAVRLDPGVQYGVIELVLSATRSTGAGACAGCSSHGCLVLNSILLRRVPGQGSDVFLIAPASAASNWATWQGTGADCAAVPTRRKTWGQIKSLYR